MAEQVLRGLKHIHSHGILHLDLKPENVLISAKGYAAISDFGISKFLAKADLQSNPMLKHTLPKISGTLLYMAPEQLSCMEVSVKTDIFAFGVLLYELVVGKLPWNATTVKDYAHGILYASEGYSIKELFTVPTWLRKIISACLSKAPAARPSVDLLLDGFEKKGFQAGIKLAKDDHTVREINRAGLLNEAGKQDEAGKILSNILKINPWNLTARINYAEVMFAQEKIDIAISTVMPYLQLAPWSDYKASSLQVLLLNLAFYLMTKDPGEAYRITTLALERFPDNWELMHNHAEVCRLLAIGYSDSGIDSTSKAKEGLSFAEKALNFRPQETDLRVTYAGLLRLCGHREKFIPYINQLIHDVGSFNIATRLLFIDALLDEGELERASTQINELSAFKEFAGLLNGKRQRLAELKSDCM